MKGVQVARSVCYRCHKPGALCLCDRIDRVDNRTAVWIVQHPRERFHPVGTARIAQLGLARVAVSVAFEPSAAPPPGFPADAGLIYPGQGVAPLTSVPPAERPKALAFIDGTWPHAHGIYRDNPWLHALPRYQLEPAAPGRYRIRRAPEPHQLSTIEAIVQALRAVEPDTAGLDGLLTAFEAMVDDQLRFITEVHAGGRRRAGPPRTRRAIPRVVTQAPERLVVAYGESAARSARDGRGRILVQWTAVRPVAGTRFEELVRTGPGRPSDSHLSHMGLSREAVDGGVTEAVLRARWQGFCRPDDVVLTWNQSSLDLLRQTLHHPTQTLLLKAAYCNAHRGQRCGTLNEVIEREQLTPRPVAVQGRASRRLGRALALLARLQRLASGAGA